MLYSRQELPLIGIEKVIISKLENYTFDIELSLSKITSLTSADYMKSLKALAGVNIVMVVLNTDTQNLLPNFQNSKIRHNALFNFKKHHKSFIKEISLYDFLQNSTQQKKNSSRPTIEKLEIVKSTQTMELPVFTKIQNIVTKNLHLLVFMQLVDTKQSFTKYLYTKGSNLEYELLLTRGSSDELLPPIKRKALFMNSIVNPNRKVPYNGSAHYHSSKNPGPNGYIGWMATHSDGSMGAPLSVVELDNYKIIYDKVLHTSNTKNLTNPIPQNFSMASTGTEIIKHAKNKLDITKIVSKKTANQKIQNSVISSLEKNSKSFFKGFGNQTLHTSILENVRKNDKYNAVKYNNYQGFTFGIDFLSMLKYRSEYGTILNFHYNQGNMGIINQALKDTKIDKITVTRTRISDRPDFKNKKGTFEHRTKIKNEKKYEIVTSSDTEAKRNYKGSLARYRSLNGEIQEINLLAIAPTGLVFEHPECKYIRQFLFKDYDIFHNKVDGTYTYHVEVDIKDGMRVMLNKKYNILEKTIVSFEKYYDNLSILSKSQNLESLQKENKAFTTKIVNTYSEIINIYDGKVIENSQKQNLISSISSLNLNLSSISKFLTSLKKLKMNFAQKFKLENTKTNKKKSFSNLTGVFPGNIQQTFKTGIKSKAFSQSKVIANYISGIGSNPVIGIANLNSILESYKSEYYKNSYSPKELLTISGQQYEIIDPFGKNIKNEKMVSQFEINKIATKKDFKDTNRIKVMSLNQKISVLEQQDSSRESIVGKGDLFFFQEAQNLGKGLKISINGKDLISENDSEGLDKDKKGLATPLMPKGIQKAIFEVSKQVDTKEQVVKNIEKQYKSAINIRSKIGNFYDSLTSTYKINNKVISSFDEKSIYEKKFKGLQANPKPDSLPSALGLDRYPAKLKSIIPGIYDQEIDISKININFSSSQMSSGKKYLLMKLEGESSKNIMPSNNLFFVEVG